MWRAICTDPTPLRFHSGNKLATINQRLLVFLKNTTQRRVEEVVWAGLLQQGEAETGYTRYE